MPPEALATNLYIGRIIATARQRKGWTQTDLAEAAGIGRTMVMDLETGRAALNDERRASLTRALGMQPTALDAPGFMLLSAEEQRLIVEFRSVGKLFRHAPLLSGRLIKPAAEALSC